jgi:hypothetical protein
MCVSLLSDSKLGPPPVGYVKPYSRQNAMPVPSWHLYVHFSCFRLGRAGSIVLGYCSYMVTFPVPLLLSVVECVVYVTFAYEKSELCYQQQQTGRSYPIATCDLAKQPKKRRPNCHTSEESLSNPH